jgi:hypothetical protein
MWVYLTGCATERAVRIKSSATDMLEGETVILTLADANILADDGTIAEEADVLEESSKAQHADFERRKRSDPQYSDVLAYLWHARVPYYTLKISASVLQQRCALVVVCCICHAARLWCRGTGHEDSTVCEEGSCQILEHCLGAGQHDEVSAGQVRSRAFTLRRTASGWACLASMTRQTLKHYLLLEPTETSLPPRSKHALHVMQKP